MEEHKCGSVLPTPSQESLPPPAYSRTWGNDVVKDKGKRWFWESFWKWRPIWNRKSQNDSVSIPQTSRQRRKLTKAVASSYDNAWSFSKKIRVTRKQCFALLLVISCGIVPLILIGHFTPRVDSPPGHYPFYGIFEDKVLSCGSSIYGTPQNATISGIEKLFVLDQTFGQFTFSQVKIIDVAWDVLVGRGVQLMAWWAGYVVFSDALLRAIERHPASFRIFQRIALEGPSLLAIWTLMKEIWAAKSRRTKALFVYMFLSTCYVVSVPLLLSAMTGYDSSNIAWVSLGDENNIVPASALNYASVIHGTKNETFDQNICKDDELEYKLSDMLFKRRGYCDCQLPNGTVVAAKPFGSGDLWGDDCIYDYPGNTQNYTAYFHTEGRDMTYNCNSTFNVEINGKTYDAQDLNSTWGYCYNNVGYESSVLYQKSRCLPDTANPSYQWGFSTMMSGVFIFLQFAWSLTMYVVWQDAQVNSTLVRSGYEMTILRAAFTMAKVAKQKTGMGERQLVRANTKELEQELYGSGKVKGTKVDYGVFVDDPEDDREDREVIRRSVRPKHEPDG
ncbi:Nn.00g069720.m01.CDS01 [Neocucurbitaria sp. VM-36]